MYRRRRLAAALLLLIVIALCGVIYSAVVSIFSNNKVAAAESHHNDGSSATEPVPHEDSGGVQHEPPAGCDGSKVLIKPRSDAKTYPDGQQPRFSVSIENGNSVECEINLGTKTMNYAIRQGDHEVFSSRHCAGGQLTDWPRRLAPGAVVMVEDFVWQRTFTTQGCPESSRKANQALAGNYSLTVQVDAYVSEKLEFVLK